MTTIVRVGVMAVLALVQEAVDVRHGSVAFHGSVEREGGFDIIVAQ